MLDRILSVFVSLLLGFLVWLYARTRDQETLDNVPIQVQVTVTPGQAAHYQVELLDTPQIPVSFTGTPSRLRELRTRLQNGEIRAAVVMEIPEGNLQDAKYADLARVLPRHIPAPPGVKPTVVEGQNRLRVQFHRLIERSLKVQLEHTSETRLVGLTLDPPTVVVRGPQELLERLRSLPTKSVPIPEAEEPVGESRQVTTKPIPLVDQLEGRKLTLNPPAVTARFTVQPRQRVYTLDDVAVQFLCPPGFALRPLFDDERGGKITLKLSGPHSEELPAVVAYVDLSGRKWEPSLYDEPVRLHIPKEYRLEGDPPGRVSFRLVPGSSVPREGLLPGN